MLTELKNYIKLNAANAIRTRAKNINVDPISEKDGKYLFSYRGSQREPYKIVVIVFENNDVRSSCTCPYDFGGLCKHEVAAITYILKKNTNNVVIAQQKNLFNEVVVKKSHDNIYLEEHFIPDKFLKKNNYHGLSYNYYYDSMEITDVKLNYVAAKQTYPEIITELTYNPTTKYLKVKCGCSEFKKKLCSHVKKTFESIEEAFGIHFFHPDYVNNQIARYLYDYGLTLDDDYKKYFSFDLTTAGLRITRQSKTPILSLANIDSGVIPKITAQEEDVLLVPKNSKQTDLNYGYGFCFNLYKHSSLYQFDLEPFRAKYKKNSTEFVSSFTALDPGYLVENASILTNKENLLFLKSFDFEFKYGEYSRNQDLNDYKEAFVTFKGILKASAKYPFFYKKVNDSFVKKNLKPLAISDKHPALKFTLSEKEDMFNLTMRISIEEKTLQLNSKQIMVFPFFCIYDNQLYLYKTPYEYLYIQKLIDVPEVSFFKHQYQQLNEDFLKPISKYFGLESKIHKKSKTKITEDQLKKQVYLSDYEGEYVMFKLAVQYPNQLVLLHSQEQLIDPKTNVISYRDEAYENQFLEDFKELHSDFEAQDGVYILEPLQLIENQWLLKACEKMSQKGIEVLGAKDLKSFKYNLNKPTLAMGVTQQTDWFDLEVQVKFGTQQVSLKDIRTALLKKNNYVTLKDGTIGILPKEWLAKFTNYFKAGEVKNTAVKISNYQFNIIDDLYEELSNTPDFLLELQRKQQRLLQLKNVPDIAAPKQLKATLRPYQKEGVNWLAFLEENQLGGCLADDMGLGKTLQVIAFFSYLKFIKKQKHTHLIVLPTSLIFNWQSEIKKFCPTLKTLIYTGGQRKQEVSNFFKHDLVLTTYGSVLNDIEELKDKEFGYIVLDESQAIKNPNSKRYKAVRLLKSKNRLALTGTPIENNTFDLYAQMNFLNPGLLGSMAHFKKEFSDAIDKAKNQEASQLLSRMIHPFLLRRTKTQVATELPEKTESILYCEMGSEQRKVYDTFKDKYRNYLMNKIAENGEKKSQMYVLEGLTKLRQICNSPELLSEDEAYGKSSVKLDLLIDQLKNKVKNHKVLVFSQFTSMLQLVKDRLDNENIAYEYLDGKTKDREEKVKNYQETESLRVFIISLKAGGVGLNLTAADYVFLIDPWWNPAVENQAIDRSYRIGQTKQVMAYKMICKDTIEEKIVALQDTKKSISNSIIQIDSSKKSFNKAEIMELFS